MKSEPITIEGKTKVVNKWVFTAYALCVRVKAKFALPWLEKVAILEISAGEKRTITKLGELLKYQP
jgi:hypothetical protein